jgi:hypothetical protein
MNWRVIMNKKGEILSFKVARSPCDDLCASSSNIHTNVRRKASAG